MKIRILGAILCAAALGFAQPSHSQDYPTNAVKFIVPYPAGGGVDLLARIVADKLRGKWGQPVVVENRAGAAGNIGMEVASRAAPDGHTLVFTSQPTLVINKSLYSKLSYDPDAFVPVSVTVTVPLVLVVHPKMVAQTVQQLLAYAKANPERLNYASGGSGSTSNLAAEFFKSKTGVKIVEVPYKGSAPALAGLLGRQADMMMVELTSCAPYVRSGKLRVLAALSEKRIPVLPDVPTVSEAVPGYVVSMWLGIVAPPKTPLAIAEKISAAVAEVLKQPEVATRLTEMGNFETVASTPAEMVNFLQAEREHWGSLIRAIGVSAN